MRLLSISILAVLALASSAYGQTLGLFFDREGTICSIHIPSPGLGMDPPPGPCPGPIPCTGTLYVQVILSGLTATTCTGGSVPLDGFTGVEFQVIGWPSSLIALTPFFDSNAAWFSSPPLVGGVGSWPSCQLSTGGKQVICEIPYLAIAAIPPTVLTVVPYLPTCTCPSLTVCDSPNFTRVCSVPGQAFINVALLGEGCTLGVQPATWTQIKELYN